MYVCMYVCMYEHNICKVSVCLVIYTLLKIYLNRPRYSEWNIRVKPHDESL